MRREKNEMEEEVMMELMMEEELMMGMKRCNAVLQLGARERRQS